MVTDAIKTGITSVTSAIGKVVTDLISSLTDLLKSLFIPSEDFFKTKIDGLIDKFCFVESVVDTVKVVSNYFESTDFSQPPKLSFAIDINKSKYDYGTKATVIDFSWYADYKPTVDIVLSAIMYLNFAWAVFKDLPNIIQGVGGGFSAYNELDNTINKG